AGCRQEAVARLDPDTDRGRVRVAVRAGDVVVGLQEVALDEGVDIGAALDPGRIDADLRTRHPDAVAGVEVDVARDIAAEHAGDHDAIGDGAFELVVDTRLEAPERL